MHTLSFIKEKFILGYYLDTDNVHKVQGTNIMTSTMIVLTMVDAYGLIPWYKMEYLK